MSIEDNVIASFILCSCFINQLASIEKGGETSKAAFQNFVKSYLPTYNAKKLREDLRDRLVHNYSVGDSYVLTRSYSECHGKMLNDVTYINIEDFVVELESAFNLFIQDLRNNPESVRRAIRLLLSSPKKMDRKKR